LGIVRKTEGLGDGGGFVISDVFLWEGILIVYFEVTSVVLKYFLAENQNGYVFALYSRISILKFTNIIVLSL
jgi:hypothetical protein